MFGSCCLRAGPQVQLSSLDLGLTPRAGQTSAPGVGSVSVSVSLCLSFSPPSTPSPPITLLPSLAAMPIYDCHYEARIPPDCIRDYRRARAPRCPRTYAHSRRGQHRVRGPSPPPPATLCPGEPGPPRPGGLELDQQFRILVQLGQSARNKAKRCE